MKYQVKNGFQKRCGHSAITFKECDTVFAEAVRTAALVKSLTPGSENSGGGKEKKIFSCWSQSVSLRTAESAGG